MQTVLDAPVLADGGCEQANSRGEAAGVVVSPLLHGGVRQHARPTDHHDRLESWPVRRHVAQGLGRHHPDLPPFVATVAAFERLLVAHPHVGKPRRLRVREERLQRRVELLPVGLDGHDVLGLRVEHLLGDLLAGVAGVHRHDGALEFQRLQHRHDGVALLGRTLDIPQSQHQPLAPHPRVDLVQRRPSKGAGQSAAQGLAIEGHDLPGQRLGEAVHPGPYAGLERRRAKRREQSTEDPLLGRLRGHVQEGAQKLLLRLREGLQLLPPRGAAQDTQQPDHQYGLKRVRAAARDARVAQAREVLEDSTDALRKLGALHAPPLSQRSEKSSDFGNVALP